MQRTDTPSPGTAFASGSVAFTGAGPGDPDLLTRQALRALARADVILHDRLISPEILAEAGPQARLIETRKATSTRKSWPMPAPVPAWCG